MFVACSAFAMASVGCSKEIEGTATGDDGGETGDGDGDGETGDGDGQGGMGGTTISTGGGAGNGTGGGETIAPECTLDSDCAWSSCDEGACDPAVKISGGSSGTVCALTAAGKVACWSSDWGGMLGDGTTASDGVIEDPTFIAGLGGTGELSGALDLAVGGQGPNCVVTDDNRVACWGVDLRGALGNGTASGDGSNTLPLDYVVGTSGTGDLSGITSLDAHSFDGFCGTRMDKTAVCWGSNTEGQLGIGTTANTGVPTLAVGVGAVGTLQSVVQIEPGWNSCALTEAGQVYCWGRNQHGVVEHDSSSPVVVPGLGGVGTLANAESLSVSSTTCAVLDTAQVACWGGNSAGQLGQGNADPVVPPWEPRLVLDETGAQPLSNIVQVVALSNHVCALDTMGEVYCWGMNNFGQIGQGNGAAAEFHLPTKVAGIDGVGTLSGIQSLGGGLGSVCAVREMGDVVCWGLIAERFEPVYELVISTYPSVVAKPVSR